MRSPHCEDSNLLLNDQNLHAYCCICQKHTLIFCMHIFIAYMQISFFEVFLTLHALNVACRKSQQNVDISSLTGHGSVTRSFEGYC